MNIRFAPSPTGKIHIGNFRTLVFVYLFAYFNNLKLICRIDDTDILRNEISSLKNILLVLHIFVINYYSYNQLTRIDKCIEYLNFLIQKKLVYKCVCADRKNCNCIDKKHLEGVYVLDTKRVLKNQKQIIYNDKIYGEICFNKINDIVICRSNKIPLYNFISVVCDISDKITLIVRGAEHITNTWQQIVIYNALEKCLPEFVHLSVVLDNNNKKISKRNKDVVSIIDLVKNGYLRSAIKNYVVLLGLSVNNNEYFNVENIKDFFKYENFHKTNAKYDINKLLALNKKHLQCLSRNVLIDNLHLYLLLNNFNTENINLSYLPQDLKRYSLLSQVYYDLQCLSGNYYNSNIEKNIEYLKNAENLIIFNQILNLLDQQKNTKAILNLLSVEFDKKKVHTIFRVLVIYVFNGIDSISIINILGENEIIKRIKNYKQFIIVDS